MESNQWMFSLTLMVLSHSLSSLSLSLKSMSISLGKDFFFLKRQTKGPLFSPSYSHISHLRKPVAWPMGRSLLTPFPN